MNFKNWKQHQSRKPLLWFKRIENPRRKEPPETINIIYKNNPKNNLEFGSKSSLGIET